MELPEKSGKVAAGFGTVSITIRRDLVISYDDFVMIVLPEVARDQFEVPPVYARPLEGSPVCVGQLQEALWRFQRCLGRLQEVSEGF